jgi:hypothetical protein
LADVAEKGAGMDGRRNGQGLPAGEDQVKVKNEK